ncbi:hypothetical protein SAMN05216588_101221 [Pseudomonas flavescens]|uniref:Uncharacterized protein n=1 Tax=Phytopseudomonas flavescens TaxID=29435 RepID=A0A1G7XPS3_9GAMM|nr:hypothetical protein [Pseudomonas flavescens]SDG86187.1 hypothetical protein SAMN05216588_101221 [Pseudomonas flavescens]
MSLMQTDKLSLLKQDGTRTDGILGVVTAKGIFLEVSQPGVKKMPRVEPGDLFIRFTSVGDETYEVLDPRFYELEAGLTDAHYQCKVKKLGVPEAKAAVQSITYNVSGNNSRVNVNSVDNSVNTVNVDSQVTQLISDIRNAIKAADLPACDAQEALEVVDMVEEQFQSAKPKRSVVRALLQSLPTALSVASSIAGIMAVFD